MTQDRGFTFLFSCTSLFSYTNQVLFCLLIKSDILPGVCSWLLNRFVATLYVLHLKYISLYDCALCLRADICNADVALFILSVKQAAAKRINIQPLARLLLIMPSLVQKERENKLIIMHKWKKKKRKKQTQCGTLVLGVTEPHLLSLLANLSSK